METGQLSINSENILPIIKKWLYSDTDIFVRELVSNATDAITKLKKLAQMGDAPGVSEEEPFAVHVRLNKENKQIIFEDNGIGMTAEEIKQYINQIAFSGASDFMEKYKDKMNEESEIIGHFGLGFYSAFMVAAKVEIDTLSYQKGAQPAKWVCEGGIEYEISEGTRTSRGTTITLFLMEEEEGFLETFKMSTILRKYCGFLPVPIYFDDGSKKVEPSPETDVIDVEGDGATAEPKEPEAPTPINDTNPLWQRQPSDCTDEDYKAFYHKVFSDFNDPLFWIHLNMDYPFRLKGILYFPKLKHELESIEGQVKLYNNQVFIADNLKEVIPEFLLLLKGTIDCPDLPLNVSRSFLQNDGYVTKMSGYITKKVADKINSLCKKDREQFNSYWDHIHPFIKYGCIREKDFYEKVKPSILFKTTVGDYTTLEEFLERNKEKTGDKVFYVTDEKQQAQYVKLFEEQGLEAVILNTNLDNPFISYLESYETGVHFNRIDSDLADTLKDTDQAEDEATKAHEEKLQNIFKTALNNDKLTVKAETLKNSAISAVVLQSEQSRRMSDMSKMFGDMGMGSVFASEETLVLNRNNQLVQALLQMEENPAKADDMTLICKHIYDLAMLSHRPLEPEAMFQFIERSNAILSKVASL